jgi:hypothetical protein
MYYDFNQRLRPQLLKLPPAPRNAQDLSSRWLATEYIQRRQQPTIVSYCSVDSYSG